MKQNVKIDYPKFKNIVLFMLLNIWILIPLLKEIKITSTFVTLNEYIYMEILAIITSIFLLYDIYRTVKSHKNIKINNLIPIVFLIIYLLWTLISSIFAKNKELAFFGTSYRKDGYFTYLIYAGFFMCAFMMDSKKLQKYLLNIFILVACFTILFIELANNRILYNIFDFNNIETSVFHNSNHYGYYLLMILVTVTLLFITQKNKIIKTIYLLIYFFIMYYFIINNTFGSYLAFGITIIAYFIYSIYTKKNFKSSIICLAIFVIMSSIVQINEQTVVIRNFNILFGDLEKIININDNSKIESDNAENINDKNLNEVDAKNKKTIEWEKAGSGRAELWRYGIQLFLERPILGYGPENLEKEYARFDIEQDRPHNLIIQLVTTSGIIGLFTYCIGIGMIIVTAIKRIKQTNSEYLNNEFEYEKKDILQKQSKKGIQELVLCVVIAYLISAMFGNSMYYTSPYFFIFLGWLMKDNIIDNSKENKSNFTKFKLNHKKLINVKKEVSQNEYRN